MYIAFVCNPPRKMHNVLNKKICTIKNVDFYTFFYIETSKITQNFFLNLSSTVKCRPNIKRELSHVIPKNRVSAPLDFFFLRGD